MKTPDGKRFTSGRAAAALVAALSAAGGALAKLGRMIWRLAVVLARGVGKLVATIWRLAGALDDALWRGTRLSVLGAWRILAIIAHLSLRASQDFLRWLPSRSGRAYSAFSAFILIVALLWIADELNINPRDGVGAGEARQAPLDLEDPILARIEGRYVHLSEVAAAARASGALREDESVTPQTAFERQLVQAYVEQKLLSRAAIDDGLQRDQAVTRQIGALRDRILAAAYMEKRIQAIVTEEAIESLYSRQSDVTRLGDEVHARHIVVATREDADKVTESLKAGAAFEELARKHSIDRATAALGGDLGYFARDNSMTPALVGAAFSTPVGELAPPFETEFGWHVLEVLDRHPTKGIPLEAVKDNIALFLRRRAIADILAQLQQDNEVVYYEPQPVEAGEVSDDTLPAPPDLRPGGM